MLDLLCFTALMQRPVKASGEIWADVLIDHFGLQEYAASGVAASNSVEVDISQALKESVTLTDNDTGTSAAATATATAVPLRRGVVMMLVGGGHYVPKINDAVRNETNFLPTAFHLN